MNKNQDWEPVILNKNKPTGEKNIVEKKEKEQNVIKTDDLGNAIGLKKITKEMSKCIIEARISKKITQDQLAQLCCLDKKIINDIEKGDYVYNANNINKISRVLGIKIERNFENKNNKK